MEQKKTLKLNIGRTIMVGLAFFTITMFWEVYDSLMPLFLYDFDISSFWTGVVMALDNVLALALLPFMGILSDRFPQKLRSKFGRRIPFIVCGSILAGTAFMMINFAHNAQNLVLMLVFTAFALVFMCLYRTPAVSLMPDVTPKPIRSKANAVINIMGTVGGVITLILMSFMLDKTAVGVTDDGTTIYELSGSNWTLVIIIASLMILASIIMAIKVNENKLAEEKAQLLEELGLDEDDNSEEATRIIESENEQSQIAEIKYNESGESSQVVVPESQPVEKAKKSGIFGVFSELSRVQIRSLIFILASVFLWYMAYNGAKTHFSVFAMTVIGVENFTLPLLLANASAFIMFIPASILGEKFGRKKTILFGVSLLVLGFLIGTIAMFFFISVIQIAMYVAFFFIGAGWASINVHSYVMSVEMATENTTGTFTGLYYTFAMGAQIITPILAGLVMDWNAKFLLLYSLVFSCLAFVTMLFVRHGNAKVVGDKLDYIDEKISDDNNDVN